MPAIRQYLDDPFLKMHYDDIHKASVMILY